jgi:exopolysaccharide production protein ExoQ
VTLLTTSDSAASIGPNAFGAAHPIAPGGNFAVAVMRWSNILAVVASVSVLNDDLLPADYSAVPQILALVMWLVLIAASAFVRPVTALSPGTDFILNVAFYCWAIGSFFWSNWSEAAILKSIALLITTIGAFRLATRLSIDDIARTTSVGLLLPLVASIIAVVLIPEIAVDHSWMHDGQWQGIFASKQSLGFLAAYLMFFALFRKLCGDSWLICGAMFLAAAACVIGSGSRGGGALALVACAALLATRFSPTLAKLLALWPLIITVVASGLMLYLYVTGYDHFPLFGTKVDLTERTFIWEYALRHFDKHPLLGYGLNGFWTTDELYDAFQAEHGWVLDNFHSGYVAILLETGVLGYTLFFLTAVLFGLRLIALISTGSIPLNHYAFIICFVALSFQMNLTETSFLRSTSYISIHLVAMLFVACQPIRRPILHAHA